MVHFEYVPSDGFDGSAMQESGGSGVREFTTQPWIMRPRVLHGKTSAYMLQALSLDSPLHIWSPRFRKIRESHLKNGTAVWVDVDNRDDARSNQAYVAMASGEAEKLCRLPASLREALPPLRPSSGIQLSAPSIDICPVVYAYGAVG
jgi:hypothetical protein